MMLAELGYYEEILARLSSDAEVCKVLVNGKKREVDALKSQIEDISSEINKISNERTVESRQMIALNLSIIIYSPGNAMQMLLRGRWQTLLLPSYSAKLVTAILTDSF